MTFGALDLSLTQAYNVGQKYLPLYLNREAEKHSLHPPWSIQPCDKC